jgi:Uma2 family endonuclease
MAITERRMTLDEFLKLPEIDEKPYLELVDGVVEQKPPAEWVHAFLQPALAALIDRHARLDGMREDGLPIPEPTSEREYIDV